jgi:hypothetical protein
MSTKTPADCTSMLIVWVITSIILVAGLFVIGLIIGGRKFFTRNSWSVPNNQDFNFLGEMRKVIATSIGFVIALSLNESIKETVQFTRQGCC